MARVTGCPKNPEIFVGGFSYVGTAMDKLQVWKSNLSILYDRLLYTDLIFLIMNIFLNYQYQPVCTLRLSSLVSVLNLRLWDMHSWYQSGYLKWFREKTGRALWEEKIKKLFHLSDLVRKMGEKQSTASRHSAGARIYGPIGPGYSSSYINTCRL